MVSFAGAFDSSRNDLGITEKSAIHFTNTSDSWTFSLGHGIDAYVESCVHEAVRVRNAHAFSRVHLACREQYELFFVEVVNF